MLYSNTHIWLLPIWDWEICFDFPITYLHTYGQLLHWHLAKYWSVHLVLVYHLTCESMNIVHINRRYRPQRRYIWYAWASCILWKCGGRSQMSGDVTFLLPSTDHQSQSLLTSSAWLVQLSTILHRWCHQHHHTAPLSPQWVYIYSLLTVQFHASFTCSMPQTCTQQQCWL